MKRKKKRPNSKVGEALQLLVGEYNKDIKLNKELSTK
jgi:hypothetical protein